MTVIEKIINGDELNIANMTLREININKALVLQKLTSFKEELITVDQGIVSMTEQLNRAYDKPEEWRIRCSDALRHNKKRKSELDSLINRLNVYKSIFEDLRNNWEVVHNSAPPELIDLLINLAVSVDSALNDNQDASLYYDQESNFGEQFDDDNSDLVINKEYTLNEFEIDKLTDALETLRDLDKIKPDWRE